MVHKFRSAMQWALIKTEALLSLPRRSKQLLVASADFIMLFSAAWLALALRLGSFHVSFQQYWQVCLLVPLVAIPVMARFGLYRAVIRYMGYNTMWITVQALTLSTLIWASITLLSQMSVPRSFLFLQWFTAVPMVAGSRMLARWLIRQLSPVGLLRKRENARNVLIYGAGSAGTQLAVALSHSAELQAVAFIDDSAELRGHTVQGLRVRQFDELARLIERHNIVEVLLAIPSMSRRDKNVLVQKLATFPVGVKVLPGMDELAQGNVNLSDIRDVNVMDLLGRESVEPVQDLLQACIVDQIVMVTGAGGSIGSELCRQIVAQQPRALILFELSEYNLYAIDRELTQHLADTGADVPLVPILGNVLDKHHMTRLMRQYHVDTVYHAAAYKHVPLVEHNMSAGIRNNVYGTMRMAEAAVECGVKNVVVISTDKAVRPTNVMGASKRLAEMVIQGISEREQHKPSAPRFAIVRFGNVLGSSGSVVPAFQAQIAKGGPVTVTDENITRYFMTIPEAATLVLQAGAMGDGGDVFVLDMGEPVRIADMAKQMIRLAGYSVFDEHNASGDIEIVYTGLRPGEKLYEELLIGGDVSSTDHPMIMTAAERFLDWDAMREVLYQIEALLSSDDMTGIRELLIRNVSGYKPQGDIVDLLSCADDEGSLVRKPAVAS